jgi:CHASE2 domain-containing sensor protein
MKYEHRIQYRNLHVDINNNLKKIIKNTIFDRIISVGVVPVSDIDAYLTPKISNSKSVCAS